MNSALVRGIFIWCYFLSSFVLWKRCFCLFVCSLSSTKKKVSCVHLETSFMYHLTWNHMMSNRDRVKKSTGSSPCRPWYVRMYVLCMCVAPTSYIKLNELCVCLKSSVRPEMAQPNFPSPSTSSPVMAIDVPVRTWILNWDLGKG